MRLLFVCKRHPQQRDLIARPYGRFYYLPTFLATQNHVVRIQLASYRKLPSEQLERDGVAWSSHDFLTLGPLAVWRAMLSEARDFRPDWIIGCSDTWAGWIAHRLARRIDCALAIDAYDNFESYLPLNLPLRVMWRRAVAAADVVTAAGPQLAEWLQRLRATSHSPVQVLPMAADPLFAPIDRAKSREHLNLPQDRLLFGYSGGWTRSRGSTLILDAFTRVRKTRPDAQLVLSGNPPEKAVRTKGVIALGYLADEAMPRVLNAADVSCVVVANTAFGRFSYPAKLYEAMACEVPVVASATAAIAWILNDDRRFLSRIGDPDDYAARMLANATMPRRPYPTRPSWAGLASRFAEQLSAADRTSG